MELLIEVPQGTQEHAFMFLHGYTDEYGLPGSDWFPYQSAWDMVDDFDSLDFDAESVIEFTGWATSVAKALFVECDDGKEYFLYSGQRHSMNGGANGYSDIMRALRQLVLTGMLDAKPADHNGILWPVHMEVDNIARWKREVIFYDTSKPWWDWWESEASIAKRAWKMYEELSDIDQL